MAEDSSWNVGQYAAEILAPETNAIGLGPDTAGIGDSLTSALRRAATNPGLLLKAGANLDWWAEGRHSVDRTDRLDRREESQRRQAG